MRYVSLLATIYAATQGRSYALAKLVQPRDVQVAASANAPPPPNSYYPCFPDGCIPENTLDGSLATHWSCRGALIEDGDEGCWIEYYFDEPQDIVMIQIAFYMGTSRTRTLNVYDNSQFHSQIQSSGNTNGYETFYLETDETHKLKLYLDDWESNPSMWISIAEVKFMVD